MHHSNDNDAITNVVNYYDKYDEEGRLADSWGQIEYVRSQRILRRYLPPAPAVILDVGGAAGRYACWLAQLGYEVHLVDPVPLHIQQAQAASDAQPETPIASCRVGDARELDFDSNYADAVQLMGPLYHLTDIADRRKALAEAYRVLKPGGCVFAVGISRFASTIDGLMSGFFLDPAFQQIMRRDLEDGQHRNPTSNPAYFMDTFFHHPEELKAEVADAGFEVQALIGVEGIGYMMRDFAENWKVKQNREFLLEILDKIDQEPTLMGASPHMVCVGRKL